MATPKPAPEPAMRRWLSSLSRRRVPQILGLHLVASLVVMQASIAATKIWDWPREWAGYCGLIMLALTPLVIAAGLRRRRH